MIKSRYFAALAAAASLSMLGAQPASAATNAAEDAPPFCSLNLATDVMVCAATEAELLTKKGPQPYSTFILARFYDKADYAGSYLEVTNTAPCDTNSDVDFSDTNVGTTWNDRISSWHAYADCEARIYENAAFGGASYGAYVDRNYVGDALNDRTTSYRLY